MGQLINELEGDCGTALATPGLLIILTISTFTILYSHNKVFIKIVFSQLRIFTIK